MSPIENSLLAAPTSSASTQSLSGGVDRRVLPNGLTVLVKSLHAAPVVAVNAWVKVGSVDELDKEKGLSHFIEHMLFKGTPSMPVGDMDRRIKAAGGYNNAHTRYESTDFIDVMPSDKFSVAIETMADALQHSSFDAAELDRERQVVLEELHRAQDNPGFEAWNRLTHIIFKKHPYKDPIIGYAKQLKKMDRKLMVNYWKKWYRPSNMVLVVVGDIDAAATHRQILKAFGSWKSPKVKSSIFPKDAGPKALLVEEFESEIETTMAVLGFPGPSELDPDAAALDMALAILGQGLSSRLNQEVREKQQLCQDISAGMFNGKAPGLIYLWAELEAGQVKAAVPALWTEVERMKAELVSPEEMARQRMRLDADEASEHMSMEGMAGKLGYYECLGDYHMADSLAQRMKAVGPEEIREVMRKYFQVEKGALVIHRPQKAEALSWKAKELSALLHAKASDPRSAAPGLVSPALQEAVLENGLKLIVKESSHTPIVAFHAILSGGAKAEPEEKAGAFNLLGRLSMKGLPDMDAEAIAAKLDGLGASLAFYADADRFAMSGQSLATHFEANLSLASRMLREATLPEEELEKERARVLKSIKDKSDQADEFVHDLFNAMFFKGAPYERPLEGSAESVARIQRDDLKKLQERFIRPEAMSLVLVGDIRFEEAKRLVEKSFGAAIWPKRDSGSPAAEAIQAPEARQQRREERLNKKQAHIMLGWPGPRPGDADYYAARLLNGVFGEGMDSRLFSEVREKRGLCYTVHALMDRRNDVGAWRVYVGTQPEREAEAIEVVLQVAKELVAKGVTLRELQAAKAYAKGIFQVARQDFGTEARILANHEFWGLGASEVERMAGKLDQVSLEEVQAAARKYFLTEKTSIAVVRP